MLAPWSQCTDAGPCRFSKPTMKLCLRADPMCRRMAPATACVGGRLTSRLQVVASCHSMPALAGGAPAPASCSGRCLPAPRVHTCSPRLRLTLPLTGLRSVRCHAAVTRRTAAWSIPLDEPWTALLLAWFASRGRSLLAAQCVVEAALQLHLSGTSFMQIQLGVKLASLGGGVTSRDPTSDPDQQNDDVAGVEPELSSALLTDQDEGELLSWVALAVLAAEVAGVKPTRTETADGLGQGAGSGDSERYLKGMRTFVVQAYDMWKGGMTLRRLMDLQAVVSQGQPPNGVQAVMQQYTRMAVMALEVLETEQLVVKPAPPPGGIREVDFLGRVTSLDEREQGSMSPAPGGEEEEGGRGSQKLLMPIGYTSTFVHGPVACRLPSASMDEIPGGAAGFAARRLGVRLLIGFMGAVLGSGYALEKFVESVFMAYSQGWTAAELLDELYDSDFEQSGGLVQAVSGGSPTPPPSSPQPFLDGGLGQSTLDMLMRGPTSSSSSSSGRYPAGDGMAASSAEMETNREALGRAFRADGAVKASAEGASGEEATAGGTAGVDDGNAGDGDGADGQEGGEDGRGAAGVDAQPVVQSDDDVSAVHEPGTAKINKQLFGSWLSCVYMALARLGAPFPEAPVRPGWAWAGHGSASDAVGLDSFVQNALKRCMEDMAQQGPPSTPPAITSTDGRDVTPSPEGSPGLASSPGVQEDGPGIVRAAVAPVAVHTLVREPFLQRLQEDSALALQLEQEREAAAREFLAFGRLRGKELPEALVKMQDEELADTSSAVRLLAAQTQLVRRTLMLALRLQGQQQAQQG